MRSMAGEHSMHLYMVYILAHGLGESVEDQHKAWSEQTCMRIGGCIGTHEDYVLEMAKYV